MLVSLEARPCGQQGKGLRVSHIYSPDWERTSHEGRTMYSPLYDVLKSPAMKNLRDVMETTRKTYDLTLPPNAMTTAIETVDCAAFQIKRMFNTMPALKGPRIAKRYTMTGHAPRHRWSADHGAGF